MIASPGAIAFELGPLTVRWYGILMATSIGVGFWLAHRQAQKEGLPADDILRVAQWAVIAGLIGARLYEVAFNWDYYGRYPWKIPAVWEGGLAMHGGIIVGFLTGVALAIHWRVPVLPSLDVAAPSVILGQAIGRWGNFFNEEAFGRPTDLPWKLYISPPHRPPEYANAEYFHPTFLYESALEPRRLLRPRGLAPAALSRPARRALLLVYRPLLGGPLRHREPAPGQLLGRGLPRRPAREPRRHRRGDHRPRLDSAAGHRLPRG